MREYVSRTAGDFSSTFVSISFDIKHMCIYATLGQWPNIEHPRMRIADSFDVLSLRRPTLLLGTRNRVLA